MHTVVLTASFERQLKIVRLREEEVQALIIILATNPFAGDLIEGSGGLRKLRFPKFGGGKSGGYRTIHFYAGVDLPIFLLDIFDKRDKGNLSKAELNAFARLLPTLVEEYRISAAQRSRGMH